MTDPYVNRDAGCFEPPTSTSLSLLERVKTGEACAWERMVALYYPLVHSWCFRQGLQSHDCVDVAQDVFLAVSEHMPRFRKETPRDSLRAWLRTITRSKLADHWRRQQKQARSIGGSEARKWMAQTPESTAVDMSDAATVDDCATLVRTGLELIRGEFEPRTWKAFWRVAVDTRPVADITEELGMTPNAVYLAKSRVLRRLREEFGDLILDE